MNRTAPKRRIDLDSPDLVWLVRKGEVSVVVEPAPGTDIPRTAETLLRVPAGGYIFGISSQGLSERITVFLETTPGAELMPMLAEDFQAKLQADPEAGAKFLNQAVGQMARMISPEIPPGDVSRLLQPGTNFRLPSGMKAAALEPLWFRMDKGGCHYGGAQAAGKVDEEAFLPLTGNLWVELTGSGRLICVSTEDLVRSGVFLQSFQAFADTALHMAFERLSDLALKKFMRLAESSQHRADGLKEALADAASIMDPKDENLAAGGPLQAIRRVGKALGMQVKTPAKLPADAREQVAEVLAFNDMYHREVSLSGLWYEEAGHPLLGFTSDGRAVALLPSRRGYLLPDPETGRTELMTKESAANIADRAMQLYPPLPPGVQSPVRLTLHSLRGSGRDLLLVGLMALLGALCGFGLPIAMSFTVDTVITNGEYGLLAQIVSGLLMIVAGSTIFELVKNAALLRSETRAQMSLQAAIFGRLLKLPVDFYRQFPAGDLSNRAMAVDNIRQTLSGSTLIAMLSSAFALSNMLLLAFYSWQLALAVFIVLLTTLMTTWLIMKNQMKFQAQVQNVIGKLAGMELQYITGINKLRAAAAESSAFARWMTHFSELRKISFAIGRGTNVVNIYAAGLPLFTSFLVFGLFLVSGLFQTMSLGNFLGFNSALGQLTAALSSLSSMALSLMFIKPMYQRAKPILETQPETSASLEDPGQLRGAVETVNVTYAYKGANQAALQGVSVKADPGQFVAIVGPSGSGKSTLLKLLLGFYPPNSGTVLYDGKPMRRLDPVKIRRQIGSVIQNGDLIQGNIYFNIMGADQDADEQDAWDAAALAAVDEDIRRMPMGMQTFVPHGGGTFSGGQRQRLMIARALSRKPKLFLLDEATSNLDNESQAKIMRNLRQINATRIVVAHRLSTVKDADLIYVMHQGRVVESGNYKELMAKDGLFARLASRQMG